MYKKTVYLNNFESYVFDSIKWIWPLYICFIFYGSLLPFEYQYISFHNAIESFFHIPYLHLNMYSREDWVANGILYLPLGYLGCLVLTSRFFFIFRLFAVSCICISIAVIIEFLQLYFPNRTVSLNDLLAEVIGGFAGIFIFLLFGKILKSLFQKLLQDRDRAFHSLLIFYMIAYFFYCFFPFDFVLSIEELGRKLQNISFNQLLFSSSRSGLGNLFKIVAEVITILPIGIAMVVFGLRRFKTRSIIVIGLTVGSVIEFSQIFIVSGITQIFSIILKATGISLGYIFTARAYNVGFDWDAIVRVLKSKHIFVILWALYILALIFINWVGRGDFKIPSDFLNMIGALSFLPFYYHYKMAESQALFLVAAYFLVYLPSGILVATKVLIKEKYIDNQHLLFIFGVGLLLSAGFEFGKLFLEKNRPDLTNLIIGSLSAYTGAMMVMWIKFLFSNMKFDSK
ncbi:VanZ family protein [uncultured Desulfobacter sp.]|uniref:VanZ family protein n=1 Tax=uncultured Desulfobacter sp. TaxID=240139 RepID=UPI0029C78092|nr:VanZ family protein [uncultured Desulfobacter sp.]